MSGYLLVRSRGAPYGLPLDDVVEVADDMRVVAVPATGSAVRGVTEIRGRTVPVVNLHAVLRDDPPDDAFSGTVVLVSRRDTLIAVEVDDADEVIRDPGLPVPAGKHLPWASSIAEGDGELIPIVDLAALEVRLSPAERGTT